ncbi:hypothetical protein RI129_003186 [Pyrocoelia pectoralis]|uniref:DDE Tnp4 domain-containing protein n=1 Tax=Pyrocoelia pectoralis TaxID=417401 RepID=A0AAN7VNW2_9COLE
MEMQAAATISIVLVTSLVKSRRKVTKRKPRQWLQRRISRGLGVLQMLNELAIEDGVSYRNYLRMLEVTLRFIATGESYRSLMYSTRIHESSISRFVPQVWQAIYMHLKSNYIHTPNTAEEWLKIAEEFNYLWQFPNCLGALDGRHIKFRPPRSDGSFYYNYKGDHSIVLLAMANAKYKFTYVNVGCNGRVSDGGVFTLFRESMLSKAMTANTLNFPPPKCLLGRTKAVPYVVVADDAFPHKDVIMKPYPNRGLTHNERIFNYRLSRARRIIENAFGISMAFPANWLRGGN